MKELCKLCTKYNYDHLVFPHLSKEILSVNTKLETLSSINRLEVKTEFWIVLAFGPAVGPNWSGRTGSNAKTNDQYLKKAPIGTN